MDIYVYVDQALIAGDNAIINISISESDIFTYDADDELSKYCERYQRLNIEVTSGFDNNQFSSTIKELLQCYYNIYNNGAGEVFLGCNGKITCITEIFQ